MPIDPEELKVRRIKREQQIQDIQNYLEEQDALDEENATGRMGHREIRHDSSISEKISTILHRALDLLKWK